MPSMRHIFRDSMLNQSKAAEAKGDMHRAWYWKAMVYQDDVRHWMTIAIISLITNAGLLIAVWALAQGAGK